VPTADSAWDSCLRGNDEKGLVGLVAWPGLINRFVRSPLGLILAKGGDPLGGWLVGAGARGEIAWIPACRGNDALLGAGCA